MVGALAIIASGGLVSRAANHAIDTWAKTTAIAPGWGRKVRSGNTRSRPHQGGSHCWWIAAVSVGAIRCAFFSTPEVAVPYRAINGPVIIAECDGVLDVPEDTRTAIRNSYAVGADWVAIDVMQTTVATLEGVLGEGGRMMIALKGDGDPQRLVDAVLEAVKATFAYDRVILGSFDPALLDAVVIRDPSMPLVGMVSELHRLDEMLNTGPQVIAIRSDLVEEAMDRIPEGVAVWALTVATVEEAQRLLELGVHGLVTDEPAVLVETLRGEVEPYVERMYRRLRGFDCHDCG